MGDILLEFPAILLIVVLLLDKVLFKQAHHFRETAWTREEVASDSPDGAEKYFDLCRCFESTDLNEDQYKGARV